MSGLLQDFRYALRQLRKSPGFTAVAVLTLALGIGATTAMFSLVDGALFRALRYPHPEELVSIGVIAPIIDGEFLFAGNYLAWRRQQTPFSGFTSSGGVNDCDLTEDRPTRVTCAAVESNFLPTFGIRPVLGRNFTSEEDRPDAPKVALLSYGLWQSRFGADRGVVGRTLSLDGKATRIVGVLPQDFEFPTLAQVGLVVPQALDESIVQRNQLGPVVRVYGRMKRGLSIETATAQLQPLFRSFVESAPPPFRKVLRLQVHSIRDLQIHDSRLAVWLLLISALALLLVACANTANLAFAHSNGRRRELAVRSALGAGRFRLFRQRLTESTALALFGCAAGCGLAYVLVRGLVSLAPTVIPRLLEARVDERALAVATSLSIIAGLASGTMPALEKPSMEMLVATTAAGTRRARLRQVLIFVQVWVSVILLSGALLFLRSLRNLQSQPLGMNTQHVVTGELTLGQQKYPQAEQRLAFFEEMERRLKQLPGIATVALSDSLPPREPARNMPFIALQAEGQAPLSPEQGIGGMVGWRSVTPDYFSVLEIPLLRGRPFTEEDRRLEPKAVILNQALAERLFPGENSLGKVIRIGGSDEPRVRPVAFTVVGVTRNTQNQGLGGTPGPEYYVVRRHTPDDVIFRYGPDSQRIAIAARSVIGPQTVAQELRDAVAALDPTIPVQSATLSQTVSTLAARPRFSATLLTLFALIGLLLAAAGIYGVVSLLVGQRTQEIAIRMALGAAPSGVTRMMVFQVSWWIALGALCGTFSSLLAARWVHALLFGIAPNDPLTLTGAAVALLAVALSAAYFPARRAAKVDPMVALRYE
jgi:putative ABC transport system permease protein